MKTVPDTQRENGSYKWFIERLAYTANVSVAVNRIRKSGHPIRTNDADLSLKPDEAETRAFFSS